MKLDKYNVRHLVIVSFGFLVAQTGSSPGQNQARPGPTPVRESQIYRQNRAPRTPPPCLFTLDQRWEEWSTNSALLLDAANRASEAGDFIEKHRNLLKLQYGKAFAELFQEHSLTNGPLADRLKQLKAERISLLEQKAQQEKFDNKKAANQLNVEILRIDARIKSITDFARPIPPEKLFERLRLSIQDHGPAIILCVPILKVAYGDVGLDVPLPPSDSWFKELSQCRERLATAAGAGAPEAVIKRALALNNSVKQLQDELSDGRRSLAQERARELWKSLLE